MILRTVMASRERAGQAESAAKVLLPPSLSRCASSQIRSPIVLQAFKAAEWMR